jgi:peptide deformylase
MYTHEGVGLAAPQVGHNIRLILVDSSAGECDQALRIMINPTYYQLTSDEDVYPEGCLSLPGKVFDVKRPVSIRARYFDQAFKVVETDLHDIEARIFLHELDHLMGILISDRISHKKFSL